MKAVADLTVSSIPYRPRGAWHPGLMFRAAEQGAVFLPSPESCFSDTSGTIPAAIGDAVAHLRDQSGNGNHAVQATPAARPVLMRVPAGGARNIHPFSQSDTGFVTVGTTPPVVTNGATHLGQDCVAIRFDQTMTPGYTNCRAHRSDSAAVTSGRTYVASYHLSLDRALVGSEKILVYFTGAFGVSQVVIDAANSASIVGGFDRFSGPSVTGVASGSINLRPYLMTAVASPVTLYMNRVQLEEGSTTTAYQDTLEPFDVREAGKPSLHALRFDGVDDALRTGILSASGVGAVSVFAGARKLSDSAADVLLEHGPDNTVTDGSFVLQTTGAAPANAVFASRGSARAVAAGTFGTAPRSAVLTGLGAIATDRAELRVNGVQVASDPADQGSGGYGDHALHLGRRAGAAPAFRGDFFGAIVRFAESTPAEIENAEALIAARAGVIL